MSIPYEAAVKSNEFLNYCIYNFHKREFLRYSFYGKTANISLNVFSDRCKKPARVLLLGQMSVILKGSGFWNALILKLYIRLTHVGKLLPILTWKTAKDSSEY